MVIYNIQTNGPSSELVIEVMNDAVYVDGNSIAYIEGDLVLDTSKANFDNRVKAYFIGNRYFKPLFRGTGKIYIKPTLGVFHKFSITDADNLIVADRAFIACRESVQLHPKIKPSIASFLSGTPMIRHNLKGTGNVVVQMPGAVSEITLNQGKFSAYVHDVAAYSANIKLTRESVANSWQSVAHKQVYVYRGTGSIFFSPHPNKGARSLRE